MDNCVKISILMPVYNVEKYLQECLDSIASQTFTDFEVICMDDGSTDHCPDILDQMHERDPRFKPVHKMNSGYGDTLNQAMDLARGEYIAFVESDDRASSNMLELLINAMENNQKPDIVKANFNFWNNGVQNYHNVIGNCPVNQIFNAMDCGYVVYMMDSVWSALYRKDFLDNNNIRFRPTPGASFQDISFSAKLYLLAERIYCINDAVIDYRVGHENASVGKKGNVDAVPQELQAIDQFFTTLPVEKQEKLINVLTQNSVKLYLWNYERIDISYKWDYLMQLISIFRKIDDSHVLELDEWIENDRKSQYNLVLKNKEYFYDSMNLIHGI